MSKKDSRVKFEMSESGQYTSQVGDLESMAVGLIYELGISADQSLKSGPYFSLN